MPTRDFDKEKTTETLEKLKSRSALSPYNLTQRQTTEKQLTEMSSKKEIKLSLKVKDDIKNFENNLLNALNSPSKNSLNSMWNRISADIPSENEDEMLVKFLSNGLCIHHRRFEFWNHDQTRLP